MSPFRRSLLCFTVAAALVALVVPTAQAQVTTGTLSGTVTTAADGSRLPGVTIEAVHVPTGTRYTAVTSGEGRFVLANVRVGGPYRVTATLEGFHPAEMTDVQVRLGAATEVPITLQLARGHRDASRWSPILTSIINPNRAGVDLRRAAAGSIESLPTVNRSLQDFARTNPYFSVDPAR